MFKHVKTTPGEAQIGVIRINGRLTTVGSFRRENAPKTGKQPPVLSITWGKMCKQSGAAFALFARLSAHLPMEGV